MKNIIQMKKTSYIILAACALLTIVGCEKRLDILPYQSISADNALESEGDVNVTLIGAYDGAQSAAVYGGDIMVLNDLIGNNANITFTGTFAGLVDAYQTIMTADNSFAAAHAADCALESSSNDASPLSYFSATSRALIERWSLIKCCTWRAHRTAYGRTCGSGGIAFS